MQTNTEIFTQYLSQSKDESKFDLFDALKCLQSIDADSEVSVRALKTCLIVRFRAGSILIEHVFSDFEINMAKFDVRPRTYKLMLTKIRDIVENETY